MPPVTIPLIKADLPALAEVADSFDRILRSGRISNFGPFLTEFEEQTGAYLGTETVTVSSGTMGLLFVLQALGLQPNQKVIVPSFTFMATAQAIVYAGGIPIFAEANEDLLLSVSDLEFLLKKHPDAAMVLPVHTYGLPCPTNEIDTLVASFAQRRSRPIPIIYDAAHAFGAARGGVRVGGAGNAEIFSLSVTKTLVSVEGGLISTRDAALANRLRKMRNYGIESNYDAFWPGLNGKMSEFHAVIGLANLKNIDKILQQRQKMAEYYLRRIEEQTRFKTLRPPADVVHTYKDLTVLVPEAQIHQRARLMELLREEGIETRAYFSPPVHQQKRFAPYADRPLPQTERLAQRVITLPFFTTIQEEQMDRVVKALAEAERKLP